ncbi:MAG: hypothetical protein HYZ15_04085 [Sphingobacteriales bacterium]|nr:hypothetical protein [Sphingobacteriales bacterium]
MEEKFSPEQSLELIQSMIRKTRQTMSDKSIYFLVWGWLTLIGCTGQFILKHILAYEKHYLVWLITFFGFAFTVYQGQKDEKNRKVLTYVDDSIKHLWAGMVISFFLLIVILSRQGWGTNVFPYFIMLYGLGTFVSGRMLRFRPLAAGGVIAWALAIAATFASYDYQMLFAAAAILFSYIIPAYLLRKRKRQEHS